MLKAILKVRIAPAEHAVPALNIFGVADAVCF